VLIKKQTNYFSFKADLPTCIKHLSALDRAFIGVSPQWSNLIAGQIKMPANHLS
jgi:hypothetical protein